MSSDQQQGILGVLTRRIFGSHPVDLPEDDDDNETDVSLSDAREKDDKSGSQQISTPEVGASASSTSTTTTGGRLERLHDDPDEVASLEGGISGREGAAAIRANSRPSLELTFQPAQAIDSREEVGKATPVKDTLGHRLPSHPVELSPSIAGTPASSFAPSPATSAKTTPKPSPPEQRREGLTPRSLQLALEASGARQSSNASEQPSQGTETDQGDRGVRLGSLPIAVTPVRTKPESPVLAASPTTNIVDDLLGEVVVGRLATSSSLRNAPPARRELTLGKEKQGIVPGEHSGELKVLTPGEEPVLLKAPEASTPLPAEPKQPVIEGELGRQSPFTASDVSTTGNWAASKQAAGGAEPRQQLHRSQEKAQLVHGDKPGDFDVLTTEGEAYHITSKELKQPDLLKDRPASPSDSTRSLDSKIDAVPPAQPRHPIITGLKGLRASPASSTDTSRAGVDAAGVGGQSLSASSTPTSRKRNRDPEGPFTLVQPPVVAPRRSEASLSPGISVGEYLDVLPPSSLEPQLLSKEVQQPSLPQQLPAAAESEAIPSPEKAGAMYSSLQPADEGPEDDSAPAQDTPALYSSVDVGEGGPRALQQAAKENIDGTAPDMRVTDDRAREGVSDGESMEGTQETISSPKGDTAAGGESTGAADQQPAATQPGVAEAVSVPEKSTLYSSLNPPQAAQDSQNASRKPSGEAERNSCDQGPPSAAELAMSSGMPLGHPSGRSQGLTPSVEQVAQAKALAGGKVDPITGHSTLNAEEVGLPLNAAELIDAAVRETVAPQPVGGFSSSVAVKPTSGTSNDLNNILDKSEQKASAVTSGHGGTVAYHAADVAFDAGKGEQGEPREGSDAREPLESVKRELVQAAAAPAISDLIDPDSTGEQPKQVAVDDRQPLTSVKRDITQASAAPALADMHGNPTTGKDLGPDNEDLQVAAGGPNLGEPESGRTEAAKTVFGIKYGAELEDLKPPEAEPRAGVAKDSDAVMRSGVPLDDHFDGVWGNPSSASGSQHGIQPTPAKAGIETAPAESQNLHKPASSNSNVAENRAKEDALPPILGPPPIGAVVPDRSHVPSATRTQPAETSLEAAQAVLPSVNTQAKPAAGLPGSATPRSTASDPTSRRNTASLGGTSTSRPQTPPGGATPRSPGGTVIEPQYVDSAAENAKRAAAAVGLGSLFASIDAASTSFKHSLDPAAAGQTAASPTRSLGFPGSDSSSYGRAPSPVQSSTTAKSPTGAVPPTMIHLEKTPGDMPMAAPEHLLSEEAPEKEQQKAVKATMFDSRVQSGLEGIEQPPEGIDIKTADPPTPTAAKAEMVGTPFTAADLPLKEGSPRVAAGHSTNLPAKSGTTAEGKPDTLAPLRQSMDTNDSRKSELVSTGSDDFDAFIDQEARLKRDEKKEALLSRGSQTSNLPQRHVKGDMMKGAGPDECAVGEDCHAKSSSGEGSPGTLPVSPSVQGATGVKPQAETGIAAGQQVVDSDMHDRGAITIDEKVESPSKLSASGVVIKPATPTSQIPSSKGSEKPQTKSQTPPATPFSNPVTTTEIAEVTTQGDDANGAIITGDAKGVKTRKRSCCFGPGPTLE